MEVPSNVLLITHLKSHIQPITRLIEWHDEKGFNILHHAVLKEQPGKVKALLDLFKVGEKSMMSPRDSW